MTKKTKNNTAQSGAKKLTKTRFFVDFNYKDQYSVSESHTNLTN